MYKTIFKSILLMLPLLLNSCINFYTNGTVGKGSVVSQDILVENFTAVENASSAKIEISKGEIFRVELSDYENLIDLWNIRVVNNRLVIQTKQFTSLVNTRAYVKIVLPDSLYEVIVSGSGKIELESDFGMLQNANVSGSGSISGIIETNYSDLALTIAGSGKITLVGQTDKLKAINSGSGTMYLTNLTANNANCIVSGSGNIYIAVLTNIAGAIYGSGNIYCYGNPFVNISDTGSGRLIQR